LQKLSINNETVFILHLRKYSETSAILDCFSQNYGRFSVLGKGLLRQSKKKKQEMPRLFQAYQIEASVRSELGTLIGLESEHLWTQPLGQKWFVANYLNEILIKLLPRLEVVPELFQQYVKTLHCLTSKSNYTYQLILFEKALLESLGYGIDLEYEAKTHEFIEAESWYEFNPQLGFTDCDTDYNHAIHGSLIIALRTQNEEYFLKNLSSLKMAKRIIRMSLKYQLGDVNLKTIAVMREVDQFTEELL